METSKILWFTKQNFKIKGYYNQWSNTGKYDSKHIEQRYSDLVEIPKPLRKYGINSIKEKWKDLQSWEKYMAESLELM